MNVIGTGLTGLVGSRVVELLGKKHSFQNISLETGVDITNHAAVREFITSHKESPWMLHLAAYTDVQGAEKERSKGTESAAWRVNVTATSYIVEVCKEQKKHLLYVDTDYAFDGTKKEYSEDDVPNPQGWYAITKSEGAKRLLPMGKLGLVIRISNPYRGNPVGKKDFVHKMMERLESDQLVTAPTDQLFVPTFIDDIAAAIDKLITADASGIYHVVGSSAISPFNAARAIARIFNLDETLIKPATFASYFTGRAPVPQYAVLTNDKIAKLGISMRSFHEGLTEVKRQERR